MDRTSQQHLDAGARIDKPPWMFSIALHPVDATAWQIVREGFQLGARILTFGYVLHRAGKRDDLPGRVADCLASNIASER